ncbi:GntR family transcriptional regulator [Undibacterium sp. CY18W]|uniref:GntR family transcriptional regulator n=1 Tax=Undibacterium hunanense TaxID=2762292 RepID=A0ABR6ZU97_9BURK|nr:GntR family transcriptional regulator [Undibacterium hunanense]MBC3919428.1 GntR family transcriptional regulator [Undibacterium hunanense]
MSKPTSDQITSSLRKNIYEGVLSAGVPLKQEELADQFGVSRIPIREALKKLEAEGLVRHEPHKGSVVTTHSIPEIIEMLDIRIGLETRALRLAMPNMTQDHLDRCQAILERYDHASKPSVWFALNLEFHLTLYSAAKKPRLIKMIEDLVLGTQRYTRIYISHILGREQPQREHYEILEALRAGAEEKAIRMLEEHIAHTQRAILAAQDD